MANRLDYFFRQKVSESELDLGFNYLEVADRALVTDQARTGVLTGLGVAQQGSPNMTVAVGSGVAYDPLGERCNVSTNQNVDCSLDWNGVTTAVAGGGNEKWLSLFLLFDRLLTDPRTDGNSLTVYFSRAETFKFKLVQGTEAGTGLATRPALDPNGTLLADIKLVFGSSSVVTAMITTSRRQDSIVTTATTPRGVRQGLITPAFNDVMTYYNNHVTGAADKHPAADLNYAGGGAWADGGTNPAATVEAQLDKIISDISASTGAAKVGAAASGFLSAGTLASQLVTIGALKRILSIQRATINNVNVTPTASAYVDVTGVTLSFTGALAGDIILAFSLHDFVPGGSPSFVGTRLAVTENGGGVIDIGAQVNLPNPTSTGWITIVGMRTVATGGTAIAKLQLTSQLTTDCQVGASNPGALFAVHIR